MNHQLKAAISEITNMFLGNDNLFIFQKIIFTLKWTKLSFNNIKNITVKFRILLYQY